MILMRVIAILFSFSLFSVQIPDYEEISNRIFGAFADEVEEKYHLQCEGDSGSMPHDIESLGGFFCIRKKMTIEEARELELNVLLLYQKRINENEKIRPFLREYPFPLERLNITLHFYDEDNQPWENKILTSMFSAKDKLCYYAYESDFDSPLSKIKEEKMSEAIDILKSQGKWAQNDVLIYKTKK